MAIFTITREWIHYRQNSWTMHTHPVVNKITIYPVKSLDGVSLQKAQVGPGGCLVHDREYAITGSNGKFVKGKNNDLVYLLRSKIDFDNRAISFRHQDEQQWKSFHLEEELAQINEFLSGFFKMPVTLARNTEGKFLDIPVQSGVTVLSKASLQAVGNWFDDMEIDETRKRFRATIEIDSAPAFWEDQLFGEEDTAVEFKIGELNLYGVSPRARCVVPTRDPKTGEILHGFTKVFVEQRMQTLPPWSALQYYDHTYYLSVDCYIPATEFGKWIAVGDELIITGKRTLPALVH